jgi:hypothetical protein
MSAQRKPVRNLYFDYWAEKYELHNGMPYAATSADWVGLNRLLTNSGKLSERMTLEVWRRGVDNYFKSDVGAHSLQKLCSGTAFVAYWRSPQDRFGKPREKASQVGGDTSTGNYASWHPAYCAAAWKIVQKDKRSLDAICDLFEEVVDLDEVAAFKRLKEIEEKHSY